MYQLVNYYMKCIYIYELQFCQHISGTRLAGTSQHTQDRISKFSSTLRTPVSEVPPLVVVLYINPSLFQYKSILSIIQFAGDFSVKNEFCSQTIPGCAIQKKVRRRVKDI